MGREACSSFDNQKLLSFMGDGPMADPSVHRFLTPMTVLVLLLDSRFPRICKGLNNHPTD